MSSKRNVLYSKSAAPPTENTDWRAPLRRGHATTKRAARSSKPALQDPTATHSRPISLTKALSSRSPMRGNREGEDVIRKSRNPDKAFNPSLDGLKATNSNPLIKSSSAPMIYAQVRSAFAPSLRNSLTDHTAHSPQIYSLTESAAPSARLPYPVAEIQNSIYPQFHQSRASAFVVIPASTQREAPPSCPNLLTGVRARFVFLRTSSPTKSLYFRNLYDEVNRCQRQNLLEMGGEVVNGILDTSPPAEQPQHTLHAHLNECPEYARIHCLGL